MIKINIQDNGLSEIWDEVLEENGWIIIENEDHSWSLYENVEFQIRGSNPFKTYANHELGEAIKQGQKWT